MAVLERGEKNIEAKQLGCLPKDVGMHTYGGTIFIMYKPRYPPSDERTHLLGNHISLLHGREAAFSLRKFELHISLLTQSSLDVSAAEAHISELRGRQ